MKFRRLGYLVVPRGVASLHGGACYAVVIRRLRPGDYPSYRSGCRWEYEIATGTSSRTSGHFGRFEVHPEGELWHDSPFICRNGEAEVRRLIGDHLRHRWGPGHGYQGEGCPDDPVDERTLLFYSEDPAISAEDFGLSTKESVAKEERLFEERQRRLAAEASRAMADALRGLR